jgi:hypothetical protein
MVAVNVLIRHLAPVVRALTDRPALLVFEQLRTWGTTGKSVGSEQLHCEGIRSEIGPRPDRHARHRAYELAAKDRQLNLTDEGEHAPGCSGSTRRPWAKDRRCA